jgi:PAS domain S-box-containing protein
VLDSDFNIIWGSIGSARVTGYTPEDIYGRSFLDYVALENVERDRVMLESLLQDPGGTRTIEGPFRHKDGSWHYYEAVVTNLLEDPAVQGIVINSRDVTERKLMEEQLLASNRELDVFATTVSHDLRTPLSLIEGYAQLMRSEDSSAEEKEAYLKSVITAARRMDELTESLLEYAQAGKTVGTAVPVEPLDVISDILFEHSSVIESKNIEVTLGKEFPTIMVDPLKLRQVVANLVNNAVKYAGDSPRPRIEIGMNKSGDTATFHIRDNGPGLDSEKKDDVFSPFKRFGSSKSPGLGIGLSTVKRAVEGWGGSIWVESEPGKGSVFYFTAPAV